MQVEGKDNNWEGVPLSALSRCKEGGIFRMGLNQLYTALAQVAAQGGFVDEDLGV